MEFPLQLIVALISTISGAIVALLLARRASEKIEDISERRIALEQEIDVLGIQLKDFERAIEIKDREIESLKSKLDEKEKEITNLKEAIKSAQISERELRRIEEHFLEMRAIVEEALKTMEEEEKRGKKK